MDDELRAPADPVIQRAELARQVTENPVFEEAAESMRMHFVHHIVNSTPDQTNVREEAYKQLRQVTENPVFEEAAESMRMHFVHHIV